jgi:hypothetical protein
VAAEVSKFDAWGDIAYNVSALVKCGLEKELAMEIVRAVCAHYRRYLSSVAGKGQRVWKHFGLNGFCVEDGQIVAHYQPAEIIPNYYYYFDTTLDGVEVVKDCPGSFAEIAEKRFSDNLERAKKG